MVKCPDYQVTPHPLYSKDWLTHEILVFNPYAQMLLLNTHADVFIRARGQNFSLSLLFDLILYVTLKSFSYKGTVLPGLNQFCLFICLI